jgi:hypothetical protein
MSKESKKTVVVVKKSVLATYRGLSLTNPEIAKRLGISQNDVKNALEHFGMLKKRTGGSDFDIKYVDDISGELAEEAGDTVDVDVEEVEEDDTF